MCMCMCVCLTAGDEEADSSGTKKKIAAVFALVHQSVSLSSGRMLLELKRNNYVTPTNYLELVRGYRFVFVTSVPCVARSTECSMNA